MDSIDLRNISSRREILQTPPEKSILSKVVDITFNPSIMLFGPSKAGKTRLIAYEAALLASNLNRRVVFLYTETNIEREDIIDTVQYCSYFDVHCEIYKIMSSRGLISRIDKIKRDIQEVRRSGGDINRIPKVYVIDSVTGLSLLIQSDLSKNLLEAGTSTTIPFINPVKARTFVLLRNIVSQLNGFLLLTAHEGGLRDTERSYGLPVKGKPRLATQEDYLYDAEIYIKMPPPYTGLEVPRSYVYDARTLVTLFSRRTPENVGQTIAFVFKKASEAEAPVKKKRKKKSSGEEEAKPVEIRKEGLMVESGESSVIYTPRDMLDDESNYREYIIDPVIPVPVSTVVKIENR